MRTFWIIVSTIGTLMCLCLCGVLAAGVYTGIIDARVDARVDPDWIPPALSGDSGPEANPTPMRLVDYHQGQLPGQQGIGSITIGQETILVPEMTEQFGPSRFPLIFSEKGQVVTVEGPVVVQADDSAQIWDPAVEMWQVITGSVGEYAYLQEGTYWFRIQNYGGQSYFKLLETIPASP